MAVVQEGEGLKHLRQRCKNSLFVAVAILGCYEQYLLSKALYVFCGPVYDRHSLNAEQTRGPETTLSFYVNAAKEDWLKPLKDTFRLLRDLPTLEEVGFTCSWNHLLESAEGHEGQLLSEDGLAGKCHAVTVELVRHRAGSMAWHSKTFPGLLALFGSASADDREWAWNQLVWQHAAWQEAAEQAEASTFLSKLVAKSHFQTRATTEVVPLL